MPSIYAPARRRRASLGLALATAAIALLAMVPPATAGMRVSGFLGSPTGAAGTDGGLFSGPTGIAINQTGAGGVAVGEIYVADTGNHRIQQFDPSGAFVRAWGFDVIEAGVPNDTGTGFEVCDTTAPVPNVPSDCQAGSPSGTEGGAMDSPRGIAVDQSNGNVVVVDGGHHRLQTFEADGGFVNAFGWDVVAGGGLTFEVCAVAASCQASTGGGNAGQLGGESATVAVGPGGDIYLADTSNRRIQRFSAAGAFVSAWGWDVVPPGKPGELGGTYERCPASAANTSGNCQEGDVNENRAIGHFGNGILQSQSPTGIAVDSTGKVYAADPTNYRVLRFASDGTAPAEFLGGGDFVTSPGAGIADLAIGQSDRVLATTTCYPENPSLCPDAASGHERDSRIREFDSAGTLQESHLVDAGIGQIDAIAANTATGELYAVRGNYSEASGNRVFILDEDGALPLPALTIDSPSGVGAHTVTLEGTVDPNGPAGIPTAYRFEYSQDGIDWVPVAGSPLSPPDGSDPQGVTATITGLEGNTAYRARLVAAKAFGATDTVIGPEVLFSTAATPPEVSTLQAQNVRDLGADISGIVNPNGNTTEYWFEYGETTAYGTKIPIPNGSRGGGKDAYVTESIEGLKPETTYHFRLVAQNTKGTTEGADRAFTTRGPFAGFEARAFEQVTPTGKPNDINVAYGLQIPAPPISASGGTAVFETQGSLGGSDWGQDLPRNQALAHRTPDGWVTDPIKPEDKISSIGNANVSGFARPDLSQQIVETGTTPLVSGPAGLYQQDSEKDLLSLMVDDTGTPGPSASVRATSSDLSHVAFASQGLFTNDVGIPDASTGKAFEWHAGALRLIAIQENGTPFPGASQIGSGLSARNAMSSDGEHVFFTTPGGSPAGPQAKIYRRDNGTDTVLASPSKRTPADPAGPQAKIYLDATLDQSAGGPAAVFFASKEKLTDAPTNTDSGSSGLGDLYRYELNTDTLTNLSAETNDGDGAEVLGMVGRSVDGSRVYYVASGQVLAGEGAPGKPNLYLWHDDGTAAGETTFIATLASEDCKAAALTPGGSSSRPRSMVGDGCNYATAGAGLWTERSARVTPDGQSLLFQSTANLTGYPGQGFNQLFLFEAGNDPQDGRLSCISCNPGSAPATADALVPATAESSLNQDLARTLTADGGRVFFDSEERLVAEDANDALDAYEWSEGRLRLLSSGQATSGSYFAGASTDGDDAFFSTRAQLVGQDSDGGLYDVYDARVGGGIAGQNPPPPGIPCVGDACKPPAAPLPGHLPPPSSNPAGGAGNVSPAKERRKKKQQRKKKRKKRSTKAQKKTSKTPNSSRGSRR